jgi:RNA polymerase sigma factor (sigma-70 family)
LPAKAERLVQAKSLCRQRPSGKIDLHRRDDLSMTAGSTRVTGPPTAPSCPSPAPLSFDFYRDLAGFLERAAREVHRSYRTVDVDDLVQIGAMRAHELRRRFDPSRRASFTTFAYRSVRSAMRRFARRVTTFPLVDLPESAAPSPEELALTVEDQQLRLRSLRRGLARLDPVDAQLLLRVEGAGERVATVARTLGLDYDAARYRIRTGRARLAREVRRAA